MRTDGVFRPPPLGVERFGVRSRHRSVDRRQILIHHRPPALRYAALSGMRVHLASRLEDKRELLRWRGVRRPHVLPLMRSPLGTSRLFRGRLLACDASVQSSHVCAACAGETVRDCCIVEALAKRDLYSDSHQSRAGQSSVLLQTKRGRRSEKSARFACHPFHLSAPSLRVT